MQLEQKRRQRQQRKPNNRSATKATDAATTTIATTTPCTFRTNKCNRCNWRNHDIRSNRCNQSNSNNRQSKQRQQLIDATGGRETTRASAMHMHQELIFNARQRLQRVLIGMHNRVVWWRREAPFQTIICPPSLSLIKAKIGSWVQHPLQRGIQVIGSNTDQLPRSCTNCSPIQATKWANSLYTSLHI